MVRSLRHALHGLVAFLGVIAVGVVLAQAAPATPIGARAIGPAPGGGLTVAATFRALPGGAAANAAYYTQSVTYSRATLGGLARGLAARSGPGIAALAAIAAGGWVFDQLDQLFKSPQNPQVPLGPQSWNLVLATNTEYYAATREALLGACQSHNGKTYCAAGPITQHWSGSYQAKMLQDGQDVGLIAGFVLVTTPPGAQPFQPPQTIASDAEIGQLLESAPASWPGLITNADGSPVRTPELMNAAASLGAAVAAGGPGAPNPASGWDTGQQVGEPRPQPNEGQEPGPGEQPEPFELPAFCEWASVVCEFFDWYRDADVPDDGPSVPEQEADAMRVPWASGFGGGSCPADRSITVMENWEVTFPMTPLCDVAALLRPLLILLAAIVSLYIIVGGTRAT